MKARVVRVFKIASRVAILALVVQFLLMALAPQSDWAWGVWTRVVASVYRPLRFPAFARGRDAQCTLSDAWREASPLRAVVARKIARDMRQVASEGGLIQVETAAGRMWIPGSDRMAYAEELAEEGEQEYGTGQTGVQPGDVVLDCGANVGAFTREALRHNAGRVVAIEPAPWALECLRRNFPAEIQSGRVIVYPKGVWDKEDTLQLNVPPGMASTAGTVALHEASGVVATVGLTTIDHMVAELGLDHVDFVKMDIEGAEPNALRGALHTVQRFHPRMVISLEHRTTDPETIPALTRRLWPNYSLETGPCTNMNQHLQPVAMFARWAGGGHPSD